MNLFVFVPRVKRFYNILGASRNNHSFASQEPSPLNNFLLQLHPLNGDSFLLGFSTFLLYGMMQNYDEESP